MPNPSEFASQEDFLEACIPAMIDEGREQDQAVAACHEIWRDRNKSLAELEPHRALRPSRAYSVLTIKALDAEQRTLEGWATTPSVDRLGDIVEPMGAKFTLPLPLLHQHKHDQPVGHVIAAKPTKDGITIKARLAKIDEPGPLKDRVDTAWGELKAGLVRGLSIGFSPIYEKIEQMKDGGLRFHEYGLHEISLVTIPANADATISVVRSADQGVPAAMGNTDALAPRPGASGKSKSVTLKMERKMPIVASEQITALEVKRAATVARMEEIMSKAAGESRSTDEAERDEFANLKGDLSALDGDLDAFRYLDNLDRAKAQPVGQAKTLEEGSRARGNGNGAAGHIMVREPQLPQGIAFARAVQCMGRGLLYQRDPITIAAEDFPYHPSIGVYLKSVYGSPQQKAAVSAGTTTDSTWAGALVSAEGAAIADFLDFLRGATILGKFGTGGVPSLSHVPFRVPLATQTSGGSGNWAGEGQAKPLTRFDYTRTTLLPLKVANIVVVTEELVKYAGIAIESHLRDQLAEALRVRLDQDFLDPLKTASQFSPASITNGVTPITSTGSAADQVRKDVSAVLAPLISANVQLDRLVWIMHPQTAQELSMMATITGEEERFASGLSAQGGTFAGYPVVTSTFMGESGSPTGKYIWLVDTRSIWLGDEGGVEVRMSREASLLMDDAPNMASGGIGSPEVSGGAALVSMYQTNSIAILCERVINWAKARSTAVQGLQNVTWGQA